MGLTPRQRQFLEALAELCRTSGRSVHYSTVAEAVSVSPFSAYDMLKVLESKGVVSSEYVVESASPSPGRSAIRFRPRGALGLDGVAGTPEDPEWRPLRQWLLQRLAGLRDANLPDVQAEMLGRLAEFTSPLSYCTGVVAALLVNLRASGGDTFSHGRFQALQGLISGSEAGLGALVGLSIGSSLARLREAPSLEPLLQPACRFQIYLAVLSQESRQRLADFLRDALSAIEAQVPHASATE